MVWDHLFLSLDYSPRWWSSQRYTIIVGWRTIVFYRLFHVSTLGGRGDAFTMSRWIRCFYGEIIDLFFFHWQRHFLPFSLQDHVTRRTAMNLVLEVAREKKKQYIFLTPQDLRYVACCIGFIENISECFSFLKITPDMRILRMPQPKRTLMQIENETHSDWKNSSIFVFTWNISYVN